MYPETSAFLFDRDNVDAAVSFVPALWPVSVDHPDGDYRVFSSHKGIRCVFVIRESTVPSSAMYSRESRKGIPNRSRGCVETGVFASSGFRTIHGETIKHLHL